MWTKEERKAVFETLGKYINKGKIPGKLLIEEAKENSGEALENRDWKAVKNFIKNFLFSSKQKR